MAALTYRWEQDRRHSVNESEIWIGRKPWAHEADLMHSSDIVNNGAGWEI